MADYDAIIIGAGQAGPPLAGRLAQAGRTVAIVERHLFGGTCVNTGCTPTKAFVASAYAAHTARRGEEYGFAAGAVSIDMRRVKARKDTIVAKSRNGLEDWLRGMPNCTVYSGHARFVGPREVRVGATTLSAEQIFINVGGRAAVPQLPGIQGVPFLTNSSILELDILPEHLLIIGGSYVGLEFGQMFRRFGSRVTVIEMAPRLIAREDEDISAGVTEILEEEGVEVRTRAECMSFVKDDAGIRASLDCESGAPAAHGSHLLLAVGRRPNTDDLGLDQAGVETDEKGYIVVDDQLRTSVPGIWALGDCNGKGAFTHTSYNDFEIVAANLLDNEPRRVSDRIPAYGLYTDPPLARAGLTETEARNAGKRILVAKRPMTRVARAVEKGEAKGFMKLVVDADTRQFLGAALLGVGCDEVVHAVLDLIYAKAPCDIMRRAMHIHPTVSELLPTMLGELRPAES